MALDEHAVESSASGVPPPSGCGGGPQSSTTASLVIAKMPPPLPTDVVPDRSCVGRSATPVEFADS
jgi:hypothetical protein